MPAGAPPDSLQEQLNRLAAAGAKRLKRWALRCACDRYFAILFPAAACTSGAILLAVLLDAVSGTTLWPFGLVLTICIAVALPIVLVAGCVLFEFARHRADRRMCLALYDRDLGLKDRLQAADQYLTQAQRSDFEQAAVEDARGHVTAALERRLPPLEIRPPDLIPPHRRLGALALVLLAGALWLGQYSATEASVADTLLAEATPGGLREDSDLTRVLPDPLRPRPASLAARRNTEVEVPGPGQESRPGKTQAEEFSTQRQSTDRSAAGSDARRSNRSRQAQSGASGQRAEKQEQDDDEARKTPARKKPPKDRPRKQSNPPKEAAGLKGGKGEMSGGRMASSDHPSAQDKTRQPEPEGDSDYGDEEEDEEQKAGSASKPLINQRKAPVNRSLTPSADGGEERDDLNGRSGPGGLKKTRGVAAMLLGVPLPDYLQGQVNPGRMKIQSEQGRAEEHAADPALARQRPARDGAVGHTLHREIPPLGRDVVRNYFIAQRTNGEQAPEENE